MPPPGNSWTNPLFITGDPEWDDYTVEVKVRPLSLDDMAGVVFRYHTNRHYYLFASDGRQQVAAGAAPAARGSCRVPRMEGTGRRGVPLRHHALLRV